MVEPRNTWTTVREPPEPRMFDPLDDDYPSLIDDEAIDEIELTSDLMIAASHSDGPLSETEVDSILGIGRAS